MFDIRKWSLLFLVVFTVGCKSKQVLLPEGPVPNRTTKELLKALENHNYPFEWYALETSLHLENPDESVSGKAYIRMKKDSIIWSSVKKMSAEGVRTLITEDSYATVNRLDGTYQRGSTKDALDNLGVSLSFAELQQAIFGNVVMLDSSLLQVEMEGNHYILKGIEKDMQLTYWINGYSLELEKSKLVDYRGRTIHVHFNDYQLLEGGQKVPFYRQYTVPYDDRGDAEVVMKVQKIEIDIPKKTRFSIPPHYEKI